MVKYNQQACNSSKTFNLLVPFPLIHRSPFRNFLAFNIFHFYTIFPIVINFCPKLLNPGQIVFPPFTLFQLFS